MIEVKIICEEIDDEVKVALKKSDCGNPTDREKAYGVIVGSLMGLALALVDRMDPDQAEASAVTIHDFFIGKSEKDNT